VKEGGVATGQGKTPDFRPGQGKVSSGAYFLKKGDPVDLISDGEQFSEARSGQARGPAGGGESRVIGSMMAPTGAHYLETLLTRGEERGRIHSLVYERRQHVVPQRRKKEIPLSTSKEGRTLKGSSRYLVRAVTKKGRKAVSTQNAKKHWEEEGNDGDQSSTTKVLSPSGCRFNVHRQGSGRDRTAAIRALPCLALGEYSSSNPHPSSRPSMDGVRSGEEDKRGNIRESGEVTQERVEPAQERGRGLACNGCEKGTLSARVLAVGKIAQQTTDRGRFFRSLIRRMSAGEDYENFHGP